MVFIQYIAQTALHNIPPYKRNEEAFVFPQIMMRHYNKKQNTAMTVQDERECCFFQISKYNLLFKAYTLSAVNNG